jgi:hypothetical protein
VSDGGAVHNCGSFGWVIGHKDGRRLAQGSGSVFGFDPRSYRAEGHGAKASHFIAFDIAKNQFQPDSSPFIATTRAS